MQVDNTPISGIGCDLSDYKRLLDNLYDGVYFVDCDRRITYWNKAAETLTGYKVSEVIGTCCSDNILMHVNEKGDNLCQTQCPLSKTMASGQMQEADAYLHHKNGHRVPVSIRTSPIMNKENRIIGAVEIFSDNSAKQVLLQKVEVLQKLALLDPLTKVGNRRYAEINLQAKLDEMLRYGWRLGILFVDVDYFKKINDAYSHNAGDKVLKMVAATLENNIRNSDMVGRWGGDEFVVILSNTDESQLYGVASKLRALVEKSAFFADKDIINVTVSIGATIAQANDTIDTLVKRADKLGYQSKVSGRNRITVYQPTMEI